MSNIYFDFSVSPSRFAPRTIAKAEDMNARFDEVSTGFDGVQTALALKAPSANPTFTGTANFSGANLTLTGATLTGGTFTSPTINSGTLNNAALTGVPTAPTAALGTVSTQVATTAFVAAATSLSASLPTYTGTSSSSVAIGTGTKTFTTESGKNWYPGMTLQAFASTGNFMLGVVTAYSGTTLTISSTYAAGSGTHSSWAIGLYAFQPEVDALKFTLLLT